MRNKFNFLHGPKCECSLKISRFKLVFSVIFVTHTKIFFRYDFEAPFMYMSHNGQTHFKNILKA